MKCCVVIKCNIQKFLCIILIIMYIVNTILHKVYSIDYCTL